MDPEESECERLLRDRDPAAIPRLMARYQRPLFSFLVHQVRDRSAAEDLLQETFLRVLRAQEAFVPQGRLSGWLFTIARRLAYDHLEKRGRWRLETIEPSGPEEASRELPDLEPGPDRAAESGLTRSRVEAALAALPAEQREVFLLREYAGLSFAEIAEATGAPLGTALARMRYALSKLRKELEDLSHA